MSEVRNERKELASPIGSLFWRGSGWNGNKSVMKELTQRGCRVTKYYVRHLWFSPAHMVTAMAGSKCLGHYQDDSKAREVCENHFKENSS